MSKKVLSVGASPSEAATNETQSYQGLVTKKLTWAEETMLCINKLTPSIEGKAFDPDWFLLRQRLEQFEAEVIARNVQPSSDAEEIVKYLERKQEWANQSLSQPYNGDYDGGYFNGIRNLCMEMLARYREGMLAPPEARPVPQPATEPDAGSPVPIYLTCPKCGMVHVDEGEWATRPHKTHQCQECFHEWRPFPYATVGIPAEARPVQQPAPQLEKDEGDTGDE